ncbi:phosphotransferase enzyme family protein [Cellulomonas sp. URHE0023]|uniref:phosphotransferase enzyme family protein n=1 Tax=Cellulomonas sp. URHE0023 TaxID=1380354 RepID=UPI000488CD38|nr:phosphotransferase [Cellulomonas sp. URHE0023]
MTNDQAVDPQVGTASSLAVFDALRAGSPAPQWLLAGIVDAWNLDPARTTADLITVSENATFVVRVDGRAVAVTRVARPGYVVDPAAFESEVAWVEAIALEDVARVPTSLRTREGRFVARVLDATGTPWWCVSFQFLAGSILEDVADPVPHYRTIGRTTALLHEHADRWTPPAGFVRHAWELADMVGPSARWGRWEDAPVSRSERVLLRLAQSAALNVLVAAPRGTGNRGLIHADLRPSNIMVCDDGLAVIDFDDCGYGWYAYDFAAALTFMEHVPFAPEMAQEWLAGYSEVRPLDVLDVRRACALSMVRRLQMLGWTTTHREDALPPALWAAQTSGTLEVAERFLRNPTWLVD